jgi:hypothetical protein
MSPQVPRQELPPKDWVHHRVDRAGPGTAGARVGGEYAGGLLLRTPGSMGAVKGNGGLISRGNLPRDDLSMFPEVRDLLPLDLPATGYPQDRPPGFAT